MATWNDRSSTTRSTGPATPSASTSDELGGTTWSSRDVRISTGQRIWPRRACNSVVVAGLSMGATLGAWVTARNPAVAGLVAINGMFEPPAPAFLDLLRTSLEQGCDRLPAIGSDIAMPGVSEGAYEAAPIQPLISLMEGTAELHGRLSQIRCPVLILTSREDHVVPPSSSDVLAGAVAGPVERVPLERSYHVATLDFDRDLVEKRTVEFALRVTAASLG